MSMKPGATTRPCASMVRVAVAFARLPIFTIRSPLIATSAVYAARPEPSTTLPPLINRSNCGDWGIVRRRHRQAQMMADLNIEKPASLIGIGEHTSVVFTKDAITIARNETIDHIAQCARNHAGHGSKDTPNTTELARGAQHRIGALQHAPVRQFVVFDHVQRVEIFRIDAVTLQDFRGEVALQRCETQPALFVVLEQKL